MYILRKISPIIILRFAWKYIIFFLLWATLAVFIFHYFDHEGINIAIPFLPLSTIGIAVSFYVGFKNNAAYDRFWEGRKIWGGIVNYSRTWGNQVHSFITEIDATSGKMSCNVIKEQQQLIYRHIAWLYALKLQLRRASSFSLKVSKSTKYLSEGQPERKHWNEEVMPFLELSEYQEIVGFANPCTQLIRKQGAALQNLAEKHNAINEFRFMEMMKVQEEFYNLQGKCERIKNTPFPRQYAYFSSIFTWIFILLLPYGLVGLFVGMDSGLDTDPHALMWLTVPFSTLISWIFYTMEVVGDSSEDLFEGFINDVPMTALCRTIEIDLREMLGETDLPNKVVPSNGILM